MRLIKKIGISGLMLVATVFWSCDAITPQDPHQDGDYSCEGCHVSESMLTGIIDGLNLDPPDDGHSAPG